MTGGPSQLDTFDLKPGHPHGGPFREIQTSVPGIRVSEHLPKVARLMEHLVILRSMSSKEADHGRATYLARTGHVPGSPVQYPGLGSLVAKELERPDAALPSCVSIAPYRFVAPAAFGAGFLGPRYAPLVVGEKAALFGPVQGPNADPGLKVQDLDLPAGVSPRQAAARTRLREAMDQDFIAGRHESLLLSHQAAYQAVVRMMQAGAAKAFDLDDEPPAVQDRYGRSLFGRGCLLARRLVERGVPFVEVALSSAPGTDFFGWDTHQNNFGTVPKLSRVLDAAWASLMADLKARGLLDSTLVVWMGEFGRTPQINDKQGRDHWSRSWSAVLAGGGIKGGQVVGRTRADGLGVEERPVSVPDLLATVCRALGIDPRKPNPTASGRPISIVDPAAKPIQEILA
jgi:hypothetical protein